MPGHASRQHAGIKQVMICVPASAPRGERIFGPWPNIRSPALPPSTTDHRPFPGSAGRKRRGAKRPIVGPLGAAVPARLGKRPEKAFFHVGVRSFFRLLRRGSALRPAARPGREARAWIVQGWVNCSLNLNVKKDQPRLPPRKHEIGKINDLWLLRSGLDCEPLPGKAMAHKDIASSDSGASATTTGSTSASTMPRPSPGRGTALRPSSRPRSWNCRAATPDPATSGNCATPPTA